MKKIWSSIFLAISLVGCASTQLAQQMELGKYTFENGQYRDAMDQLLPIAVAGKPEAQYAVGYMYYYGFGVAVDEKVGLVWIHKSAEQGYEPAIKALTLLAQPKQKVWITDV